MNAVYLRPNIATRGHLRRRAAAQPAGWQEEIVGERLASFVENLNQLHETTFRNGG
jgi:hypothetical protein